MYTLVNQEKALVGAFSVIVKTGFGTDGSLVRVLGWCCGWTQGEAVSAAPGPLEAATLGWGLTAVRRHHRSPPPAPAPAYHQYPVGNITRATPAAPAHPTWHRVSRTRTSRDNLSTYIKIVYFYPT